MSEPDEGQLVAVDVGECRCPGTPHASDSVYLAPRITIPMGIAATSVYRNATNRQDLEAGLGAVWLRHGIRAWTFVRESDSPQKQLEPVPITPDTIEQMVPWNRGGFELADRADTLYAADFLDPLVKRSAASLKRGQTPGSTSPTPPSGASPRKRSRPSSQNGQAGRPSVVPAP